MNEARNNPFTKQLLSILLWVGLSGSLLVAVISCSEQEDENPIPVEPVKEIRAVDISSFPEIRMSAPGFYNSAGDSANLLDILKGQGVNTIRLRLWLNPADGHSGFNEVQQFSQELRSQGFQIWLSIHYSDTWADPGQQETPESWQGLSFAALTDSVEQYTARIVRLIRPDLIQLGNEINTGFLHPTGHLIQQPAQCQTLLSAAAAAVRQIAPETKIILHFAGINGADWFFDQLDTVDYDVIGLSYYPIWHGKSLETLQTTMEQLSMAHQKEILIAETAYPFTLDWNDYTHNIVGTDDQLILPDFPASPTGQEAFIREINRISQTLDHGIGFCYWGAALIAWKGSQGMDASPWENQALFDFTHQALPALEVFGE